MRTFKCHLQYTQKVFVFYGLHEVPQVVLELITFGLGKIKKTISFKLNFVRQVFYVVERTIHQLHLSCFQVKVVDIVDGIVTPGKDKSG